MPRRVARLLYGLPRSLRYGFGVATLGVFVAWIFLPPNYLTETPPITARGLFRNDFARRWGGGCNGWTTGVATWHVVGHALTWYAYSIAAFAILVGHPLSIRNQVLRGAIVFTGCFIQTCGATHLIAAYAVFNPIYIAEGIALSVNGGVSVVGSILICYALEMSRRIASAKNKRLAELEAAETMRRDRSLRGGKDS